MKSNRSGDASSRTYLEGGDRRRTVRVLIVVVVVVGIIRVVSRERRLHRTRVHERTTRRDVTMSSSPVEVNFEKECVDECIASSVGRSVDAGRVARTRARTRARTVGGARRGAAVARGGVGVGVAR